jgi:hypothetical protein
MPAALAVTGLMIAGWVIAGWVTAGWYRRVDDGAGGRGVVPTRPFSWGDA